MFKQEFSGVGATLEKRWKFCAFEGIKTTWPWLDQNPQEKNMLWTVMAEASQSIKGGELGLGYTLPNLVLVAFVMSSRENVVVCQFQNQKGKTAPEMFPMKTPKKKKTTRKKKPQQLYNHNDLII